MNRDTIDLTTKVEQLHKRLTAVERRLAVRDEADLSFNDPTDEDVAHRAAQLLKSERARHAEEVERLKARIAELETSVVSLRENETVSARHSSELRRMLDETMERASSAETLRLEVAYATGVVCDVDGHDEPGPDEAILDAVKRGYQAIMARAESAESALADLTGDDPSPGFGVDPKDSAALVKLRSLIDDVGIWPSEESEVAGDYEAAVRHMAEMCRERSGLHEQTYTLDLRDPAELAHCKGALLGHHVRVTIRALYPIGPPAEVSKAEGRDA